MCEKKLWYINLFWQHIWLYQVTGTLCTLTSEKLQKRKLISRTAVLSVCSEFKEKKLFFIAIEILYCCYLFLIVMIFQGADLRL